MNKTAVAVILFLVLTRTSFAVEKPAAPLVVTPANVGKVITVEGWAVNSKIGASLSGDGFNLWIDGLDSWPKGYYKGGDRGKKLRVTGVLAEDHGIPVFIHKKGEPWIQGVPVPEGTDLKKASRRYILKSATWKLLER